MLRYVGGLQLDNNCKVIVDHIISMQNKDLWLGEIVPVALGVIFSI